MLDAALEYARLGLAVFPLWHVFAFQDWFVCGCGKGLRCANPGKHPQARFVPHGHLNATLKPEMIRHWWSLAPNANVGVATSRHHLVLDVDPRHGGDKTLAELEQKNGPLPPSWRARTGGGGTHIYFTTSTEIRNSVGKIGEGLDVRGDGGYVVGVPSLHVSGQRYSWIADPIQAELALLPAWLLTTAPAAKSVTPVGSWRELVKHGVGEGRRNDAVARLAGHLLRREVDPLVAFEILATWNAVRCRPPLEEAEVAGIVARIAERELRRRGEAT